jgi:hypothetical protein
LLLDEHLRYEILSGKRKRKLKNVTIKIDPLQVKVIKKLPTMKSMYENKLDFADALHLLSSKRCVNFTTFDSAFTIKAPPFSPMNMIKP